jgi:hypothetical protein
MTDLDKAREDAINEAIDRLAALTGDDFHGYRSEIWAVAAQVWRSALAARQSPAEGDAQPSREWAFDRYHYGIRMAEGARVIAKTEYEAMAKAQALFPEPENRHDTFYLRPDQSRGRYRFDVALLSRPSPQSPVVIDRGIGSSNGSPGATSDTVQDTRYTASSPTWTDRDAQWQDALRTHGMGEGAIIDLWRSLRPSPAAEAIDDKYEGFLIQSGEIVPMDLRSRRPSPQSPAEEGERRWCHTCAWSGADTGTGCREPVWLATREYTCSSKEHEKWTPKPTAPVAGGPEVGDVVIYYHDEDYVSVEIWDELWSTTKPIVLMRRAEVERIVKEARK